MVMVVVVMVEPGQCIRHRGTIIRIWLLSTAINNYSNVFLHGEETNANLGNMECCVDGKHTHDVSEGSVIERYY